MINQKVKITLIENSHLDERFAYMIEGLIDISGQSSVIERKDNDNLWKEEYDSENRLYAVESVFTEEETKFLQNNFNVELL